MAQSTWEDSLFTKELDDGRWPDESDWDDERVDEEFDDWEYRCNNQFARDFFNSLPSSALLTQLVPVQCCTCCTSITAAECKINLSEVSAAKENCQVCALLFRTAKYNCNNDEQNVQIVRRGSALKIGSKGPRILRLCSDLKDSADSDGYFQISFPVLPEAESPARFALFRAWLRQCDESHSCDGSHRRNTHRVQFKATIPTRLLYVGDPDPDVLRLYCPKENNKVQYVALSHCWGKLPVEDKKQFCTTQDNISQRLGGFSFAVLPRTFRDAVRVTRELGIKYLWIDSLCIIQWDQKDWEHEAKRMEGVFASAYCTIAATSAVDSNAGFLERNISSEYIYAENASGRRFYVCTDIDNFDDDVNKAQLNTRAWVTQERYLSRRTIHFSANQAYFECGNGVFCENFTIMDNFLRTEFFISDPNFPSLLLAYGDQRTTKFIHFLAKDYSKRSLTNETDRCVAMSGLEASLARGRRCESRYGIFQRYLHRNLMWWRSEEEKTPRIKYENRVVPSWSWMAYGGGIQFYHLPYGRMEFTKDLQFDKNDEYALVADVGVFRNCNVKPENKSHAILDSSGTNIGLIEYDIEASGDLHVDQCVVVGRKGFQNEHGSQCWLYAILVVRPTIVDGEYMRVGVGYIAGDYIVRQRLNVRVV